MLLSMMKNLVPYLLYQTEMRLSTDRCTFKFKLKSENEKGGDKKLKTGFLSSPITVRIKNSLKSIGSLNFDMKKAPAFASFS